ncbi:hypothetical protein [Devosia sediminis]|uniref:Uncharacterized protein n=1 Tax=Devosia sediminis TaxID=2798801 RepID=A0A934INL1_9HYPH|nr:hypothetical protein [Devosia sediminis]MBJ3784029.1 hypothetical protein [Devosia sediminis]
MQFILTREQAYELAWSAPLTTLALDMGISNVALGKSFRVAGIPLPGPGYWNKLKAGKPARRLLLADPHLGSARFVHISGNLTGLVRRSITGEPGERADPWEPTELLKNRFVSSLRSLSLPQGSKWVHRGVQRLLDKDDRTVAKAEGSHPIFAQIYRPKFRDALGVRRLKFINRLAYALERAGGSLSITNDEASVLDLHIGSGSATCRIEYRDRDLCVSDFSTDRYGQTFRAKWADDETGRLEAKLSDIIIDAAVAAWSQELKWRDDVKARRIQRELELEAEAARRRALAEEQQRQAEKKARRRARKKLVALARGADEATLIRRYVRDAQERLGQGLSEEELVAWTSWALRFADSIDPWKNGDALHHAKKVTLSKQEDEG